MARMRTIPQAVAELKAKDPDCCVGVYALRHWVKAGLIPSVRAGKYFFIDLDALERFLAGEKMGHADTSTMVDIYGHAIESAKKIGR